MAAAGMAAGRLRALQFQNISLARNLRSFTEVACHGNLFPVRYSSAVPQTWDLIVK